jgi:hypothetical protein
VKALECGGLSRRFHFRCNPRKSNDEATAKAAAFQSSRPDLSRFALFNHTWPRDLKGISSSRIRPRRHRAREGTMAEDLRFEYQGSFTLLVVVSDLGREWVNEHLETPAWVWTTKDSITCDHANISDIAAGAISAGLAVTLCS